MLARVLTIMIADSVHDRLLAPVFEHFGGTAFRRDGDACLVRFDDPTAAVMCGVTLQEVLRRHNVQAEPGDRLHVRVAISMGQVVVRDDDVLGDPVIVAARLEGVAEPGEVYFTESVYLAMDRSQVPSTAIGERTFPGVAHPVRIYQVLQNPDTELGRRLTAAVSLPPGGPVALAVAEEPRRKRINVPLLALAAVLIVGAVAVQVWVLMGGLGPRPLEAAREAWERGDVAAALEIVDHADREGVDANALHRYGKRVVAAHTDALSKESGPRAAYEWLAKVSAKRAWLNVEPRLAVLDAEATVARILATAAEQDKPWPVLEQLILRHPGNAAVPLTAARGLRGKVYGPVIVRLFEAACETGAPPPEDAFGFCIEYFGRVARGGHTDPAHSFLRDCFPERRVAWAREAARTTTLGTLLEHAVAILDDVGDPLARDPILVALRGMTTGFHDAAEADRCFEALRGETDPAARARILALHRWVIDPEKGVSWSLSNRALVERNLERLRALW